MLAQAPPGDDVVLYTDGVTDARSAEGFFGEARLRGHGGGTEAPRHGLAYGLLDEVTTYQGGSRPTTSSSSPSTFRRRSFRFSRPRATRRHRPCGPAVGPCSTCVYVRSSTRLSRFDVGGEVRYQHRRRLRCRPAVRRRPRRPSVVGASRGLGHVPCPSKGSGWPGLIHPGSAGCSRAR